MGRVENIQLNVRSAFARDRVQAIGKLTGMTASEVIEDTLRGYVRPVFQQTPASWYGAARCWFARPAVTRSA